MKKNKKVLIVDDDPDIVELLTSRLEANGYKTVIAYDGIQAVQQAVKEKPGLVLLDLNIPASDGISIYKNYKKNENLQYIPVIFVSALITNELKDLVKSLGAQGIVEKPFNIDDTLAIIKQFI